MFHAMAFLTIGLSASATMPPDRQTDVPINALILTGQNNHNWRFTSRVHKDTLEATGRFHADISDDPARTLADADGISRYRVFIVDYNGPRWGEAAEANFLQAVNEGRGVVIIHAANNAFVGWPEYEKLCGLMWINGSTGHGRFHEFDIRFLMGDHPILKGLAEIKAHPDELYHNLINTQKATYDLLGTAYSSQESGGTGKHEPMILTLSHGKGRIFHTPLGHVWTDDESSKVSVTDPQFKILLARGAEWAATGQVALGAKWRDVREHNRLTEEEQRQGWTLLFDGQSPASWRGYKKDDFPSKAWEVKDGVLRLSGAGGGDIVTREQYGDFEFACDWKVEKGGNSGIYYRSTEDRNYGWETGPEYQILDDGHHADGKKPKTRAGTLYDVVARAFDVSRPHGEWNHARIVARGGRIEHWLNGFKVVEIDMASEEYKKAVAASKWAGSRLYGSRPKGHIVLQDHGDVVEFRNIRVRTLGAE